MNYDNHFQSISPLSNNCFCYLLRFSAVFKRRVRKRRKLWQRNVRDLQKSTTIFGTDGQPPLMEIDARDEKVTYYFFPL